MNEFDAEYEQQLAEARRRAGARGRDDVADYLNLRATNDALRAGGCEWLLQAFTALAAEANRAGASVETARAEAQRFRVGNSTMVGPRLTLRAGVRSVTVEAGWPRSPGDGIVRGRGLACARVGHFGDRAAGQELLLVPAAEGGAHWFVLDEAGARTELREESLGRHFNKLLGRV